MLLNVKVKFRVTYNNDGKLVEFLNFPSSRARPTDKKRENFTVETDFSLYRFNLAGNALVALLHGVHTDANLNFPFNNLA